MSLVEGGTATVSSEARSNARGRTGTVVALGRHVTLRLEDGSEVNVSKADIEGYVKSARPANREKKARKEPDAADEAVAKELVVSWDSAKADGDFATADAYRTKIRELGFEPGRGAKLYRMR